MTLLTLRLSDQPVITLPADLARLAGLQEGQVQVIPDPQRVTVLPMPAPADYAARGKACPHRSASRPRNSIWLLSTAATPWYWETVAPLFDEAERFVSAA